MSDDAIDNKPKKATRSRKKIISNTIVPKSLQNIRSCYCRRCQRNRELKFFYNAVDDVLDCNGYMSICRTCMAELYDKYYASEKSLKKAIFKACKTFNVRFDDIALDLTEKHIETSRNNGKIVESIFGIYIGKLILSLNNGTLAGNMIFSEAFSHVSEDGIAPDHNNAEYFIESWGEGLSENDYLFLEHNFFKFKETHKADTFAEIVLLRRVCKKLLFINKAEIEGDTNIAKFEKELMELMKSLAISPQYAKMADGGKNLETFGNWIAEIEREEPAEWLEHEGNLYKDVDNTELYFDNYIRRPLRNLILQSQDFNLTDENGGVDNEDVDGEDWGDEDG